MCSRGDCEKFTSLARESPQWATQGKLFTKREVSLPCCPLVTSRTFPGGWRIELLTRFYYLIVTTCAVPMKGLLVVQRNQLSADFKLDLRNFG